LGSLELRAGAEGAGGGAVPPPGVLEARPSYVGGSGRPPHGARGANRIAPLNLWMGATPSELPFSGIPPHPWVVHARVPTTPIPPCIDCQHWFGTGLSPGGSLLTVHPNPSGQVDSRVGARGWAAPMSGGCGRVVRYYPCRTAASNTSYAQHLISTATPGARRVSVSAGSPGC